MIKHIINYVLDNFLYTGSDGNANQITSAKHPLLLAQRARLSAHSLKH